MATRILLRRDTAGNWISNNPLLLSGEIGIEIDTLKFKIGNGSRWNDINSYAFNYGQANGVASLNSIGKIDLSVLPGDVVVASELTQQVTDAINALSTSDIEEGSNRYFTNERAIAANADALAEVAFNASEDATNKAGSAEAAAISAAAEDATFKVQEAITTITGIINTSIDALTTSDIPEGSNKYFTDARAKTAVASDIATAIAGVTLSGKTTNNLAEGSTNLYFTPLRALQATANRHTEALIAFATADEELEARIASNYVANTSLDNRLGGYIEESDRNQQSGFAGLDSNTKILESVVPDSIARIDAPQFTGNASVENLEVSGNLTFTGVATTVNSENLTVSDSIIYLADSQFNSDLLDIGIYGAYGDATAGHYHTGLVRDHSDKKWKLFSNGSEPTDNHVDFGSISYDTLKLGLIEANSATIGDVSNAEIQYLSGVTSGIQSQINSLSSDLSLKASLNSPQFTGTIDFTGVTVSGLSSDSNLPTQIGNAGNYLVTDGNTATWQPINLTDYLSISAAAANYLNKDDAASTYLSQIDASTTYTTQSYADATYLNQSNASTTYLTKTDAAATYQNKIAYGTSATPTIASPNPGDVYIQY